MMNYLKSLVLGGPKAEDGTKNSDKLRADDISRLLTADDFEDIITTSLEGTLTLYELR